MFTPRHGDVQAAERYIRESKGRLDALVHAAMERARADLEVMWAQRRRYEEIVAELDASLASFPQKEAEIARLDRELEANDLAYRQLLKSLHEIQLAEVGTRDSQVQLISPAGPPEASDPRDPVRLSLAPDWL